MSGAPPALSPEEDARQYRHEYPMLGDVAHWNCNVQFYQGRQRTRLPPSGDARLTLPELQHAVEMSGNWLQVMAPCPPGGLRHVPQPWLGQLLMPIRDGGVPKTEVRRVLDCAPIPHPLQPHEIDQFLKDPVLQANARRTAIAFLACIGFVGRETGAVFYCDLPSRDRPVSLQRAAEAAQHPGKTGRAVSRFLKFLGEVGFRAWKPAILMAFATTTYSGPWHAMQETLNRYWVPLVRDGPTRRQLESRIAALVGAVEDRRELAAGAALGIPNAQPSKPGPSPAAIAPAVMEHTSPPPAATAPPSAAQPPHEVAPTTRSSLLVPARLKEQRGVVVDGEQAPYNAQPAENQPEPTCSQQVQRPQPGEACSALSRCFFLTTMLSQQDQQAIEFIASATGGHIERPSQDVFSALLHQASQLMAVSPGVAGPIVDAAFDVSVIFFVDFTSRSETVLDALQADWERGHTRDFRVAKVRLLAVASTFAQAALTQSPALVSNVLRDYVVARWPPAPLALGSIGSLPFP
jgi:hypothetical protein